MANLTYVRANRIRTEIMEEIQEFKRKRNRRRKTICFVGLPLLILLLILKTEIFFLAGFILIAALAWSSIYCADNSKISGAEGEDHALALLKQLPDEYTIFNQVEVPDRNSSRGFREIDFIVAGPTGLFAIEIKNNNSEIVGSEADAEWKVYKVGRGGTPYSKTMSNPIRQLKGQVHALSKYLMEKQVRSWVNGIVSFTNANCELRVGQTGVPVLHGEQMIKHIMSFKSDKPARDIDKAIVAISELIRDSA